MKNIIITATVCLLIGLSYYGYTIIHKLDEKYTAVSFSDCTFMNGRRTSTLDNENVGTCFIIKHNKKYYIATNYHILVGCLPSDTTSNCINRDIFQIPNLSFLRFQGKNRALINGIYPLLDQYNQRFFLVPKPYLGKRMLDLAFLPIDTIPNKALVNVIDLDNSDTSLIIQGNSYLYAYGFKGNMSDTMTSPICDTFKTIDDFPYKYNDMYIFCNKEIHMFQTIGGESGGPVYYKDKNNKMTLVGMVSMETDNPIAVFLNPEMNNIKPKMLYEFISLSSIKNSLDQVTNYEGD